MSYFVYSFDFLHRDEYAGISLGVVAGWLIGYFLKRLERHDVKGLIGVTSAITALGVFVAKYLLGEGALSLYIINILGGLVFHRTIAVMLGEDMTDIFSKGKK